MDRTIPTGVLIAGVVASTTSLSVCEPLIWPATLGGNGHAYEEVEQTLTWPAAKAAAESMTFRGVAGHLVTLTSTAEQDFVVTNVLGSVGFDRWIGAFQPDNEPVADANWMWVTGEPFGYANWAPTEPGDLGGPGREQVAMMHSGGQPNPGDWHDAPGSQTRTAFLVEFPLKLCEPDLAAPYGALTIDDVLVFLGSFVAGLPQADLAEPIGVLDIDDVLTFLEAFAGGCFETPAW